MGRCAYCGAHITSGATLDHIIPKSIFDDVVFYKIGVPDFLKHLDVGQAEHEDNLFAACKSCNEYKSDLTIEAFRRAIMRLTQRLHKTSLSYRTAKQFGLLVEQPKTKIEFFFEICQNSSV